MVITMWVLAVVPVLLIGLVMLVIYGPWVIATAWDSLLIQYNEISSALKAGRTVDIILGLLNIGALVVPVAGSSAILWRLLKGRLLLRTGVVMLALAATTALSLTLLLP